eukprot:15352894-Ditylum_brightwellii.AAC.1
MRYSECNQEQSAGRQRLGLRGMMIQYLSPKASLKDLFNAIQCKDQSHHLVDAMPAGVEDTEEEGVHQ